MPVETVTYAANGLKFESELHLPEGGGRQPGVLIFPDAGGLGEQAKATAARLAAVGYVALACDYYGGAKTLSDMNVIMPLLQTIMKDVEGHRARATSALAALTARPEVDPARIAAIGYCFGGTTALELARSGAALAGTVGFHSGLQTQRPDDAGQIKGKVLVCLGADDPMIGPEARDDFVRQMTAGKVDWQMHLYGGVVHSFTNKNAGGMGRPDMARYDAAADARSWEAMRDLFKEIF